MAAVRCIIQIKMDVRLRCFVGSGSEIVRNVGPDKDKITSPALVCCSCITEFKAAFLQIDQFVIENNPFFQQMVGREPGRHGDPDVRIDFMDVHSITLGKKC